MPDLFDIEAAAAESSKKIRIDELADLIKKYQNSYYNGEAEISDAEFDRLWDELKVLDPENAVLISDLLFSMADKYKKTLILVTHDLNLAKSGDEQLRIVDGKLQ